MIFVHKNWEKFCKELAEKGIHSQTAFSVISTEKEKSFLVLKHDVETDVKRAYDIACIESKYGHCGSYYVQGYLLESSDNVELLRKMQEMGHEISYHYDVLDFAKGDMEVAISEFDRNMAVFEKCGFTPKTLCQHGNPVVERVGYTSNRDFFRSERVQNMYPTLSDIMVNFKSFAGVDYTYFSDAGRKFKLIFDPINNDVVNSDDKNIPYDDVYALYSEIESGNCIISIHPHRWTKSAFVYVLKSAIFKTVRFVAKIAIKIPFVKKFASKYYHLAKKM